MQYKDVLEEWLFFQQKILKKSTYANYYNVVYNHIIIPLGNYELDKITKTVLQDFVVHKLSKGRMDGSGGLCHKSVSDLMIIIKTSLRYAMQENYMHNNSNLTNIRMPKNYYNKKIEILSNKEQKKLVKYIKENINYKNYGIFLCIFSGMRIGEICALKWSDLNFKNEELIISKTLLRIYKKDEGSSISLSEPKTKSSHRIIPLSKDVIKIGKSLRTNSSDFVLSGTQRYIEPNNYRRYYNMILKKINIDHYNFHCLRHTFATNMIEIQTDVKSLSEILGHSSVSTTMNLYVHPKQSYKKKMINRLEKKYE